LKPARSALLLSMALVACGALATAPRAAAADEGAASPKRAEARARFDRGTALLKEHDEAGALAEFQATYDLLPAPQTLLMIGVLSGALNRPVEAVKALDRVLAEPGPLSAQQLAIARARREEQALKVGLLHVVANVNNATIQLDGVDVGVTPFDQPIAVAVGTRLVAALGSGYLPTRKEVTIAGGVTSELSFELVPSERRAAHLFVHTSLVDADVVVDGERVARTPLVGSITVGPGDRLVELRRPGYGTVSSKVSLGDGATAELTFAPVEAAGAEVVRGTLALDATEPESELTVDGAARGVYRAPVALPAGRHLVRVVHGGFVPSERVLQIPENAESRMHVTLVPTPETRDAYVTHARAVRRWGWIATASGVVIAGAGTAALVALLPKFNQAKRDRDALFATFSPGGECDSTNPRRPSIECNKDLKDANDLADSRATPVNLAAVVTGVGAAALVTGVVLLVTGNDPARYDTPVAADAPLFGFAADPSGRAGGVLTFRRTF
jgi:PEGA domain